MSAMRHAIFLALSDYWRERLLSVCAILGLAAVLAPLMVLLGVHYGIITAMTERLTNDPATLEVIPVGSGKYGPAWFAELNSREDVAFVLPQTRSIAATMTLRSRPDDGSGMGRQVVSPLIASAQGDPLLSRRQQEIPGFLWRTMPAMGAIKEDDGSVAKNVVIPIVRAVISESLARKLRVSQGGMVEGRVDRVHAGRRESAGLPVEVLSILPASATNSDVMYVPLELLVATEDYRDGRAVPFLDWPGDAFPYPTTPSTGDGVLQEFAAPESFEPMESPSSQLALFAEGIHSQREYASFRLYARSLDDVAPLWQFFQGRNVEVYVKAAEIETVKNLDRAFTLIFTLITGAAMCGFCASTASNALAGVRRKSRSLGIMRLIGFPRSGMLLFPVSQTTATGLFGSLLAYGLYLCVAYSIDILFADSLPGSQAICSLPPEYVATVFGVVLLLSALSSMFAAWQATNIEPSEVIRDV